MNYRDRTNVVHNPVQVDRLQFLQALTSTSMYEEMERVIETIHQGWWATVTHMRIGYTINPPHPDAWDAVYFAKVWNSEWPLPQGLEGLDGLPAVEKRQVLFSKGHGKKHALLCQVESENAFDPEHAIREIRRLSRTTDEAENSKLPKRPPIELDNKEKRLPYARIVIAPKPIPTVASGIFASSPAFRLVEVDQTTIANALKDSALTDPIQI